MSKFTSLIKISVVAFLLSTTLTACAPVATGGGAQWVPGHVNRYGVWVPGHYMPGAVGPVTGGPWVPGHYNRWGGWVPGHSA